MPNAGLGVPNMGVALSVKHRCGDAAWILSKNKGSKKCVQRAHKRRICGCGSRMHGKSLCAPDYAAKAHNMRLFVDAPIIRTGDYSSVRLHNTCSDYVGAPMIQHFLRLTGIFKIQT